MASRTSETRRVSPVRGWMGALRGVLSDPRQNLADRTPAGAGRYRPELETLEDRLVLTTPNLVAIFANTGTLLEIDAGDPPTELTQAPTELTLRFNPSADPDDAIDPATLGGITVVRSGGDGVFGNGNDQVVPLGFAGIGAVPNEVVVRFASRLPDDQYQVVIDGAAPGGLADVGGDAFAAGGSRTVPFGVELGARVIGVVHQPVTRGPGGTLTQARNQIEVFFNDDDLELGSALNANYYSVVNVDSGVALNPVGVTYDAAIDKAVLTFAADIPDGTWRLRIGNGVPVGFGAAPATPAAAITNADVVERNSSFAQATANADLGAIDFAGTEFTSSIDAQAFGLDLPGGFFEPGHRFLPNYLGQNHVDFADSTDGITTRTYSVDTTTAYGIDPSSNEPLFSAITADQQQLVRQIFELWGESLGLQFIEQADGPSSDTWVILGDLRAGGLSETGPGGAAGVASGNLAIVDAGDFPGFDNDFLGGFFTVAMHEVGHTLGFAHSDEVPLTVMAGGAESAEPGATDVFGGERYYPADGDVVHGQYMYRPEAKDIDLYAFEVTQAGTFGARITAQGLSDDGVSDASNLDALLTLFDEDGNVVARNDDYFGRDSFIGLELAAGSYFIGVTASGNDAYDPTIEDSGFGGVTQGAYRLSLSHKPDTMMQIVDGAGTALDGDADGVAGGEFNFWFQVGPTLFVDKAAAPGGNGSAATPFDEIDLALAAATAGDVVRIVGNGGADGDVNTLQDNLAYTVGLSNLGQPLADGAEMKAPAGVAIVIDAGAIIKLRRANVEVGTSQFSQNRAGGSLQVLGVFDPDDNQATAGDLGRRVFFTSLRDDGIGGDVDGIGPAPAGGDWGGLVFFDDSDREADGAFVNTVFGADIRYGGGTVIVDSIPATFSPITTFTSRPTVGYNTIRDNASAAISADPNSFEETLFGDYDRVGLDLRGNRFAGNTINGVLVRVETLDGAGTAQLTVGGRFDDTDVVHVLTENLFIAGGEGGLLDTSPLGAAGTGRIVGRQPGRLAIDSGLILKSLSSRIEVGFGGVLLAEGIAGEEIVMTSLNNDGFGAGGTFDTNGDGGATAQARGDWSGIYFSPTSSGSLDGVELSYAGGTSALEGPSAAFNAVEIRQTDDVRIANSLFFENAGGLAGSDRDGLGNNVSATIYVLGSTPTIVNNVIRDGGGVAISADINSLGSERGGDEGRSRGSLYQGADDVERLTDFESNRGPLVRLNRLQNNAGGNGLEVRGGVVTGESVLDDTDIVHIVRDEITVGNFHTFGGLRLVSQPDASLVVKLAGADAGFTASGTELEIDDRIGGSLQVIGTPQFGVIFTSLADDSVSAGFDVAGVPLGDTNNDGAASSAAPGDWRSLRIDPQANDANVALVFADELSTTNGADVDATTGAAQFLGTLSPGLKGGNENRRLGFQVEGTIASDDPGDVDVYSFDASPGTEVYIDIDRTDHALDTVVELIDVQGNVIARSDNSLDEEISGAPLTGTGGPQTLDGDLLEDLRFGGTRPDGTAVAGDLYTTNPLDAGFRVVLPGPAGLPPNVTTTYYVRVRSGPAAGGNLDDVDAGVTTGSYQLQVRLDQTDQVPGTTVRYADIRFATDGIEVIGQPGRSPLAGEAGEPQDDTGNEGFGAATEVGNLLARDLGTISIAGELASVTDVDWYRFEVDYQLIQSIAGVNGAGKTWSTVFDLDYADGLVRPDTTLSLFTEDGTLVAISRDSTQADDRAKPGQGNDVDDLSRGSVGALDAYLGSLQLPEGDSRTYYVAVHSNAMLPTALATQQFVFAGGGNDVIRLEPVNSVQRIVEDHIGFLGYTSGNADQGPTATVLPDQGVFDISSSFSLATHVREYTLDDVVLYVSTGSTVRAVNPFTGATRYNLNDGELVGGADIGDLDVRDDDTMYFYYDAAGNDTGNAGQIRRLDGVGTVSGGGGDGIGDTYDGDNDPPGNQVGFSDAVYALLYVGNNVAQNNYTNFYSVFDAGAADSALFASQGNNNSPNDTFFSLGEITIGGDTDAVRGLADLNGRLYGLNGNGLLGNLRSTNVGGNGNAVNGLLVADVSTLLTGGLGAGERFEGLTLGPRNIDTDDDGVGDLAETFFAITNLGRMIAFDATGAATAPFSDGAGGFTGEVRAAAGATGLAFANLDFNLWHPTMQQNQVAGHGINPAFDNTRTALPTTQDLRDAGSDADGREHEESDGGTSFYFGLEQWDNNPSGGGRAADDYVTYGPNAQYGILQSDTHRFLTNGPDLGGDGNYDLLGGARGTLETDAFSLADVGANDKPTLYFNYFLETEQANGALARDTARVYVTTDGGQSYTLVATNNTSGLELPDFLSVSGNGQDAGPGSRTTQELFDANEWRQARIDLSEFAGQGSVRLRFDFSTSGRVDRLGDPAAPLPGTENSDNDIDQARNNDFEGFYIDDVVVGMSGRGEIVTGAQAGQTGFTRLANDNNPNPGVGNAQAQQVLVGEYQLELRHGTEFAVPQFSASPDLVVDPALLTQQNGRTAPAQTFFAASGGAFAEGQTLTVFDGLRTVVFEFDTNGAVSGPGNAAIAIDDTDSAREVAAAVAAAVNQATANGTLNVQAITSVNDDAVQFVGASRVDFADTPSTDFVVTESETNDSLVNADFTFFGSDFDRNGFVNGSVTDDDIDLFRLYLAAGDTLQFGAGEAPPADLAVRLFDSNGRDLTRGVGNELVPYTAQASGIYFVGVSAAENALYDPIDGSIPANANGDAGGGFVGTVDYSVNLILDREARLETTFVQPGVLAPIVGDRNTERIQGQLIVENNTVSDAANVGILIDAGPRDPQPQDGPVRNLAPLNDDMLVPGPVARNNLVVNSGAAGIRFSGDPSAGDVSSAPVPYGRIINNTVVGDPDGPGGIGIEVTDRAAPVLLNNVVAFLGTGIRIDGSSEDTVVAFTAYSQNGADAVGIDPALNGGNALGTVPLVIGAGEPLFIDASGRNFIPAEGARIIDSSQNSRADRSELVDLKTALAIPPSPVQAPRLDRFGQLRQDDPNTQPIGGGANVFIDRGAIDRVDFSGPIAILAFPVDNGTSPLDKNPAATRVEIGTNNVLDRFVVNLSDGIGTGIDDGTVTPATVTITRDGVPLVAGVDFVFNYDSTGDRITVTPIAGRFDTGVYEIILDNDPASGIRDLAGNPLAANRADGATAYTILFGDRAVIGDMVFRDTDGNGLRDPGERGIAGVEVRLLRGGGVEATDFTDGNGLYRFTEVAEGAVQLQFVTPTGFVPTTPDAGDDARDSDIDANGFSPIFGAAFGTTNLSVDAGYVSDLRALIGEADPVPSNQPAGIVDVNFSAQVTGVDIGDFSLTRDGVAVNISGLTLTGSGSAYRIDLGPVTTGPDGRGIVGDYVLMLNGAGSGIQTAGGADLQSNATETFRISPSVTADIVEVTPDPRDVPVTRLMIDFSEAVTGFDAGDLTLTRDGVAVDLAGVTVTPTGPSQYVVDLSTVTLVGGTYVVTLNAAGTGIEGVGANALSAGDSDSFTVLEGLRADIDPVDPDIRTTPVARAVVRFSQDVSGVDLADFALTRDGQAISLAGQTVSRIDARTYSITLSSVTGVVGNYELTLVAAGSGIVGSLGSDLNDNAVATFNNFEPTAELGLFRDGTFLFDTDLNGTVDRTFQFGGAGDEALVADYDGDGILDLVVVNAGNWRIDTDRDGVADITFAFGGPGDRPFLADLDGDGVVDPIQFVTSGPVSTWVVDLSGVNGRDFAADFTVEYGIPGDRPFVGDWNGDGRADLGLYRNGLETGGPPFMQFFIDLNRDGGAADAEVWFGVPGDEPFLGDFNGDGNLDPGVFRFNPDINGGVNQFFFDLLRDGGAGEAEVWVENGQPGDAAVFVPPGQSIRVERQSGLGGQGGGSNGSGSGGPGRGVQLAVDASFAGDDDAFGLDLL